MIITKRSLPRRTFLRGIGTTLALPLLEAMVPAATMLAQTPARPTKRLGFLYTPNGIIMDKWRPTGEGLGFEFGSTMNALEPFRERVIVVSGLAQVSGRALGDGPGDHARAGATWLTGVHPKKTEGTDIRAAVSADQLAAQQLGKQTQLGSLELGLEMPSFAGTCDTGYSCAYTNTISWSGPTTPLPVEVSPRALFERLFGSGDSTDPADRLVQLKRRRSQLDYISETLNSLQRNLGPRDRSKLDEYLHAIRDVERRIQMAEEQNATLELPHIDRPASVPEEFEDHAKLMMDLMVLAYQTDLTRVVTFMMAREGSNRSYRSVGVPDGHHSVTHHRGDAEKIDKTVKINELFVRQIGYLARRLQETPEGDGTLLDHSILVYGASLSDANVHTHHDLPTVLIGGGAGQFKGGRHVRVQPETPLNNLWLNLLDSVDVPLDRLGDSTGRLAL